MNQGRGRFSAVIALAVLAGVWVLPPLSQKILGLCPVRSSSVGEAQAVPAFARKYGMSCSQCHTAFPALNDYGRQFKLDGYVREREKKEGVLESKDGALWTEKTFPWGALVKARPYDKKTTDEEFRFRALHELELFIAGGDAGRKVSYFTEIEMEDEPDALKDSGGNEEGAYHPIAAELQLGYHPSAYANILLANRSFFALDPYQTLSDMGRLTVSSRRFAGSTGGVTNTNDMKQTGVVYGEAGKEGTGSLYYAGGLTAQKDDPEGKGYKSLAYRLAFDTLKGVMIGTFGHFGSEGGPARAPASDKIKFSRVGVDALVEAAGVTGRAVLMQSSDENLSTKAKEKNRGAYAEVFYAFKQDDKPTWVPLIRQDWYQTNDGQRQFAGFTAQVSRYLAENTRAFVEYSADTLQTGATGAARPVKDHRWVAQLEMGF